MRKEDAYMASMQSFAMGTSFQLPVEIVLEGDRPVKTETFMIWMRALIDNAYAGEDKRPISMYVDDERFCDFILGDKRVQREKENRRINKKGQPKYSDFTFEDIKSEIFFYF